MARTSKTHITVLLENRVYPDDVRVNPHVSCLQECGYDVTVICPRTREEFAKYEIIDGVRVYRFPFITAHETTLSYILEAVTGTFFLTLFTLWVWMRHGIDLLLVYNPPDVAFITALIPKLMGRIIVFDVRDVAPELYQAKFLKNEKSIVSLLRAVSVSQVRW